MVQEELPEAGALLASRELTCACVVAVHGSVLAVLEPGGAVPQPPAALSRLPPPVPHPQDPVPLGHALQGHAGCLGHQVQLQETAPLSSRRSCLSSEVMLF